MGDKLLSLFLTRECESNERIIAFDGQISLARWAVNNRAINLCILIYSFTSQLIGGFDYVACVAGVERGGMRGVRVRVRVRHRSRFALSPRARSSRFAYELPHPSLFYVCHAGY